MSYRSKYDIKTELETALRPFGEVQSETPLGALVERIADEVSELHTDLANLEAKGRPDNREIASELWKLMEKKNDVDRAHFIDGLKDL